MEKQEKEEEKSRKGKSLILLIYDFPYRRRRRRRRCCCCSDSAARSNKKIIYSKHFFSLTHCGRSEWKSPEHIVFIMILSGGGDGGSGCCTYLICAVRFGAVIPCSDQAVWLNVTTKRRQK